MPVLETFVTKVAASLTAKAVEAAGKGLRESLAAPPRQKALERSTRAALEALIAEGFPEEHEGLQHAESVLDAFFAEPAVQVAVAGLLRAKGDEHQQLAALFRRDYDAGQISLDLERGFAAFALAFFDQAVTEDELQGVLQTTQAMEQTSLLRQILSKLEATAAKPASGSGAEGGSRAIEVGGDVSDSVLVTGDGVTVVLEGTAGDGEELLAAYHRALAKQCARLPLGLIDEGRLTRKTGDQAAPLPDIYVDLDVLPVALEATGPEEEARRWALRLARGEGRERVGVLEAVAETAHRQTVLLGEAGSGKTTFIHYLAYLLASGHRGVPKTLRGLVPVRLVLRDVAAQHIPAGAAKGHAAMLWSALETSLGELWGASETSGISKLLRERLVGRGGLLLLDGLDEVPEAQGRRRALLEAVADLTDALGERSRVLVTARPYAYADPKWRLSGFSTLALAPFSEPQVERFAERWFEAFREGLHLSEPAAQARARELATTVLAQPYLADLASRPLLLTLIATLDSSGGRLPDDRADLYEAVVRLLLGRWQRARKVLGPGGEEVVEPGISETLNVGEEKIRSRLDELALGVHERQRQDPEGREAAADISEGELLVALRPVLEQVGPEKILSYLKHRAGLLVERREGVYAFAHRSFQEYLAASYLAGRPNATLELRRRVAEDPAWWREVFLLAAGKAHQGGLGQAVTLVTALLGKKGTLGEAADRQAVVAGAALLDLRVLERAEKDLPHYEEMVLDDARRRLVAVLAGEHLAAPERAEAGRFLAKLGDPREAVTSTDGMEFCWVPAGEFWLGEGAEAACYEVGYDYWLGRFPVTQAQFGEFVNAGGYGEARYFEEAAAAGVWQEGKIRDRDDKELYGGPWKAGEPYDLPNHPVVGVGWYEALAFCRWLEERWHERGWLPEGWGVQLPSEPEWEKAARGGLNVPEGVLPQSIAGGFEESARASGMRPNTEPRCTYPWGEEGASGELANFDETGVGTTSAVGCFPRGRSSYGCEELAGNVWEWTRSVNAPYPYPSEPRKLAAREDLRSTEPRVLRGGAFSYADSALRCSSRFRSTPDYRSGNLGFRLLLSPILL